MSVDFLKIGESLARRLIGAVFMVVAVVCGGQTWAADGISPVSEAFSRWQKTHHQNLMVQPAVTNVRQKARLLSQPQVGQIDEPGLIPTVFNSSYLGNVNRSRVRGVDSSYPAKYDLRTYGWVSPVKNQTPYGTCWAHATYASMESALMKSGGLTFDFSENNLVNLHGGDWSFDTGGNGDLASAYLLRWSGPVLESSDPYPNIGGSQTMSAFRHVQNVRWILPKKMYLDNDGIKDALMKYGALYVSYYHDAGWYNADTASYYFNILQKEDDGSRANNHAVAIVGWDDNYPRSNFKIKPPADGAYLVKNSMGSEWGDGGYFYVSYFDESFAWNRLYAFSNAEGVSNYDAVYQYDTLGLVNSVGWGERPTWGASIFTATNASPVAAVGFYALVPDTSYTIQIYTGCRPNEPTSGVKALEQMGQTDYAGYVTIPLNDAVRITRGQTFSVVLKLTTPGYGAPLACEYAVPGYSSAATAAAGQTFASLDGGSWRDFTDMNGTASFCCKAYTRPSLSIDKTLTALVIDGVDSVRSGKSAKFTCRAQYSDGTVKDVTESARWSIIEGGEYASVSDAGVVTAREIRDRQIVRLYAEYIDGGIMQSYVWSISVTYAAPLTPKGLMATKGTETTCVRLCWDETEDTSSYAIYRSETDQDVNAEYLGEASVNVFDDTKAVPGVMYHYFIKAKNSSGSSPFSDGAMGWRALSAPENVVAGNGTSLDYVEVTWSEAAGASYYRVYRAEDFDDEPLAISAWQMSLSFRDRDAFPGKTYLYYVVSAVDAEGGLSSGFSLFDDGRRAVPVDLKSIVINGEASIASGDASSYTCTATYTDGSIKLITQPSAWTVVEGGAYAEVSASGHVTTRPMPENRSIVLRVDHVEKDVSVYDVKSITVCASKPSAPLAVITSSSEQGISISWSVNTSSSPALRYLIYRMAAGGDLMVLSTVGSDVTAYTDRTASPGVTYTYRVSALNGAGEGPVSEASATETMPLATPSSVMASDGVFLDKVTVSWKPVPGASHYRVFRSRSSASAGAVELSDWQTETSYADTSADAGVPYWYFVKAATDGSGEVASGFGVGDEGRRREIPALDSIAISGAPRLASEGTAVFACVALYGDGTRQTVTPAWSVAGPATIDEDGRLVVDAVSGSSIVTVTAQYREGGVERTATAEVSIVVPVKATAEVKSFVIAPRWPFNGTIDMDYEIATSPEGTLAAIAVSGFDYDHGVALSAQSLSGDGANGAVSPGMHRLTWNVAADHPHLHTRSFGVEMSAVPVPVLIPTNVVASYGSSTEGVDLTWSEVDEALGYEIWRSQTDATNDAVRIAATYELAYSDERAEAGTLYHYWIRSVGTEGLGDFGSSVRGLRAFPDVNVSFDANGGNADVYSRTYEPELAYGELPNAWRTGYRFEGWFTAQDGGDEVSAVSVVPVTQVTLYAHWKANAYAIRFNGNGGTGVMGDLPMTYDVPKVLPECSFVREGYSFAGWAMNVDGATLYQDGVPVENLTSDNNTTVTLFAKWSPIVPAAPTGVGASDRESTDSIEVSWTSVVGATEYHIYRAQTSEAGKAVRVGVVPAPTTRWLDRDCEKGMTYHFWVTASRSDNGQESAFSNEAWGRLRYADIVCTFNGNGGIATSASRQYTPELRFGDLPSAMRAGYTFLGWFTEPISGSEVKADSEVPTVDALTLYAHWRPNSYVVHFDAAGGIGQMNDQRMTYDREQALTANRFTRSAYTFGGWTTSEGGAVVYNNEALVKNLVADDNGLITLFAVWHPIPPDAPENVRAAKLESSEGIVVTWSAVGSASEYYVFRDEDENSQNPQQIGTTPETSYFDQTCVAGKTYYFWIKSARANNGAVSAGFSSPAAEGRRRYPNVTVTFNGNGGVSGMPQDERTPELVYGELPTATRTGYAFAGWHTAATGGTEVASSSIVPVGGTTLYAHWTANTYFVRYDANSDSADGSMDDLLMTYDVEKPLADNAFTRLYYAFAGWATSADGDVAYENTATVKNLAAEPGAVFVLYAVWSPLVPPASENVQATLGTFTDEIALTWGTAANATAYEVWRGETDAFAAAQKIGTVTDASYSDKAAEAGRVYFYWVVALNPVATGTASAFARGALKPNAPANVAATRATYTDKVVVTWSEVAGATRYDVYRSDENDSTRAEKIGESVETNFTDTDVVSGERQYYWVAAYSENIGVQGDFGAGAEGYCQKMLVSLSIEGPADVDAGSQATYTATAIYSDGTSETVRPSWNITTGSDVASIDPLDGTLTVAASQIDHSVTIYAEFRNNGRAETTKTVAVHKVIPLEVALDSEILSFTTGGAAPWCWVEDASFVNSYAACSGVVGTGATSWFQTTVEGPCVISFRWRVSSAEGDSLRFLVDGQVKEQISGTSSSAFQQKSYVIEQSGNHALEWVYGKSGNSVAGADCGWVDDVQYQRIYAPSAPTGVNASYGTLTDGISVSWTAVAGATGYRVYRSDKAEPIASVTATSYKDTEVSPGVQYTYRVVAVNLGGASGSSSSVMGVRKLSAPTGLSASPSTAGATISWAAVDGATGYRVYRSDKTEPIASVAATSYQDTTGYPGRDYQYHIVATCSTCESAGSSITSYKRLTAPPQPSTIVSPQSAEWGCGVSVASPPAGTVKILIYRANASSSWQPLQVSMDNYCWHSWGTQEHYYAVAVGENGSQSDQSTVLTLYQ